MLKQNGTFLLNNLYKRSPEFVTSPFRYPGGKYYALKYIMPFIECVPHDEFREPFVGGGNIFFAKPKVKYNWINDLDSEIINVYRVLSNPLLKEELISMVVNEVATRERHAEMKKFEPKSDLERAYKTYYLNRTSFSGIINKPAWGYAVGKSSPPKNWGNLLRPAGEKLMNNVKITNLDFEKVINAPAVGEKVLMYLDPPYYNADQKRAYVMSFTKEDHIRLAEILKETKHLFCLSYDDCPEIRQLYSWANITEQSWLYNTANIKGKTRKKGNELIITNYNLVQYSQEQLF